MTTLKELVQKEQELFRREEEITVQIRQFRQLKSMCESHVADGKRFLYDLRYQFHQTEINKFCEGSEDILIGEYQKVMGDLEDSEGKLALRKREVFRELDDIAYEKRRLSRKEAPYEC